MKNRHICSTLTLLLLACTTDRPTPRGDAPVDSTTLATKASGSKSVNQARSRGKEKSARERPADGADTVITDPIPIETADSAGPFAVNGRYFTVVWERAGSGADEYVRTVRIRDENGVIHHEEQPAGAEGVTSSERASAITARALRGESGQGLALYYKQTTRANDAPHLRIFALRGGRLAPLGPQLAVDGAFSGLLPSSREPHVLFLLPDDHLDVEVWQGQFAIHVPYRVRFSCASSQRACVQPSIRRGDIVPGLSILRVRAPLREITSESTITMFDAPEGPGPTRIVIKPSSEVSVLEAAADVFTETVGDITSIRTRREWLHVRVDGRAGWIHGPENFAAIGLQPAK